MAIEPLKDKPTLKELMLAKQDEMEAALSANRRVMPHEGEKGAAAELRWREMLESYLPKRYTVSSGFVVDHNGDTSDQIDVIVHDKQYSPFLFHAGTSCFVPAESVYAIFDAKQAISKKTLEDTGDKVNSVRVLERTSGYVWSNTGRHDGKRADEQPILGGILAVDSEWKELSGGPLASTLTGLADGHELDLGVAVSRGAFEFDHEADELTVYDADTALVGFFTALMRKLQPLATALAMDLDVWTRDLRKDS